MHTKIKQALPYLILCAFIAWAVWQGAQIKELAADTKSIAAEIKAVQDERTALRDEIQCIQDRQDELSQAIAEIKEYVKDNTFIPAEIPLLPELQAHTYIVAEAYGLPLDTVYTVMFHESRMLPDVPDNINRNGSRDRGLMQINSCNWQWLFELGLDVSEPCDNITAGCYLLTLHTRKYGLQDGLRAYAVGARGMKNGGGYWFLEELGV